ncbi:MAG: DUF494 domain-containing protein [Proteobacteria bacterium]|nr:DUF494 domain-containing protein [Pseudomonadota bacterium]
MYDVLAYLYQNYRHVELTRFGERLSRKLSAAGFDGDDISEAFSWLAGLRTVAWRTHEPLPDARPCFRVFAAKELSRLDIDCRRFLASLENAGILTPDTREQVIERAMAAAGGSLSLAQLQLLTLLVLWHRKIPGSCMVAEDLFQQGNPDGRRPN